jgi:hypothetical protein
MARIMMQGMNHMLLVFIDQGAIAERGVHSVNSCQDEPRLRHDQARIIGIPALE